MWRRDNERVNPRPQKRTGDGSRWSPLRPPRGGERKPLPRPEGENTTGGSQATSRTDIWAQRFCASLRRCNCFRGEDRTPAQVDPPQDTESAFPKFDPTTLSPPEVQILPSPEVQILITSADEGPSTETQEGLRERSDSGESVGKGSLLERKRRARRASSVGSDASPLHLSETSGDLPPRSPEEGTFLTPLTGGVSRGRSDSVKSVKSGELVWQDPLDDKLPTADELPTADKLAPIIRKLAMKSYVQVRTTPVEKELNYRKDCLEYRKSQINEEYEMKKGLLKGNAGALTIYKIERDIIINELDYRILEIKRQKDYIISIVSKNNEIREINSDDDPGKAYLRRVLVRTADKKLEDIIKKLNTYLYKKQDEYLNKKKYLYKSKKEYIEQNPSKNTNEVILECDAVILECDANLNHINQAQQGGIGDNDMSTLKHNALEIINVDKLKEYLLSEVKIEQKPAELQDEESPRDLLWRLINEKIEANWREVIEKANTRLSEVVVTSDATTGERAFPEAVVTSDATDNPYFAVAPEDSKKLWGFDSIPSNDILPSDKVDQIIGSKDSLKTILYNAKMDDRVLHREEATSEES